MGTHARNESNENDSFAKHLKVHQHRGEYGMDKVKRFLGIKKDKKGTPAAGGGAQQAAPLAINIEDLSGSKKASHGAQLPASEKP